ncbi:putative IS6 family transposase [Streptomyces gancidicus BKS 13-15]|uniref:Putative IS6 family transposase n=1 Tax=Streptomyces gancidicus BKS 13-15 TaxID=1284664 RepID=M3DFZ0_STREZ|nr:putative IS6 family transposase [Streptomyces gancidicus BKS 13-15]
MLTQLQGHLLPAWIEAATTADLPSVQRFARHLERDLDAVTLDSRSRGTRGSSRAMSTGIKMLRRERFGPADFELLRKRVLLYSLRW